MTADHQLNVLMTIVAAGVFGVLLLAAWFIPSRIARGLLLALPALIGATMLWAGLTNPDNDPVVWMVGTAVLGGSALVVFRDQLS